MVDNIMQKRFDEYFAKVVLEYCFPKSFASIKIAEYVSTYNQLCAILERIIVLKNKPKKI